MVVDVGGDDHAASCDFVANQFRREVFPMRDVLHLLGNAPFACIMNLRPDWVLQTRRNPLSAIHVPIIGSPQRGAADAFVSGRKYK